MRAAFGSRTVLAGTGVAVLGAGVVFFVLGLDDADKLGSVVAALAALAGLGLTVAGTRRHGGTSGGDGPGGQSVHGSAVHGSVTNVGRVGGSVRLTGSRGPAGRTPRDVPEPSGDAPAGGQSVRGSRVGGDVFQAESVDGDVETRPES